MKYEDIIQCLDMCTEHINEGGGKITNAMLQSFPIPSNIKDLIKENHMIVRKIINFYYDDFKNKIRMIDNLTEALENIEFIRTKINHNKTKLIDYNNIILPWLKKEEFFINIYENNCSNFIDINDIKPIDMDMKRTPRPNQIEAYERLEKNGLETGIHCQATGCGKSDIIIRYCDYMYRHFKNRARIIIFTERVSIMKDLFSFSKGSLKPDPKKLQYWKDIGVGDLTMFNIINRVTVKKKDWCELLKESKEPTILVINRAYLTLGKLYKTLTNKDLNLVLHDECHNTSSLQCHDFLLNCKQLKITIVGFSATPLRTGKHDKPKLLEIYGINNELQLLTDYNMIYAISKDLILAPEFYWYQIEAYKEKNNEELNNVLVSDQEIGSVLELLNHIVLTMPTKKIIAWCGTINLAREWKKKFEESYKQRKNLVNFKFGLDTSADDTDDYNLFKNKPDGKIEDLGKDDRRRMYYGHSILFCANKHREGSDIDLLDSCIFLDKVKDRGPIPFIQSIGRVLRKGIDNKLVGIVIDGFVKENNNYEKQFVDKIIGYYMALENLTNINNDDNKYDRYIEMRDIVSFNKEKETIDMKLGNRNIKIHCNKLEWDDIICKFDSILQDKIKLSIEDNMIHKGIILKEKFGFNKNTHFIKEYKNISTEDKIKYNLPDINSDEYIKLFSKKNWFEFVGLEHNFYENMIEAKKELQKINYKLENPTKNWKKWCEIDTRLPLYPIYVWNDYNLEFFNDNTNSNKTMFL